jgi:exopolysaccharide production protein ExoQ
MIGSPALARSGRVLALAGFLTAPLATVAPLALAPLLALAALAALVCGGYRDLWRLDAVRPLVILLALLGFLGVASAAWSIIPLHSLLEGLRFFAICGGGLALVASAAGLDTGEREAVQRMLLRGFLLALAILAAAGLARLFVDPAVADAALGHWLRKFTVFDRGATILALAAWPAMLVLLGRGKRLASTVLILATLAVLLCLRSRSAMLCLLLAMAVWPVARMLPRASATLIGAGLISLIAILPALPLTVDAVVKIHEAAPRLDNSAIHRFLIWHFAIDRIAERPLLGWGLDASRAMPGGSERVQEPRLPELAAGTLWMPLHPHNAILQWRLELGLPGAALATLVVLFVLWRMSAPGTGPPAVQATSLAVLVASLVVAMLSYGFWQAWWQSSLWLIGALMVAIVPTVQTTGSVRA